MHASLQIELYDESSLVGSCKVRIHAILDTELERGLIGPKSYSRRIANAIEQLRQFPLSGVEDPRLHVRRFVVPGTPYILYYRLTDFEIGLATIRHGARQPLQYLSSL